MTRFKKERNVTIQRISQRPMRGQGKSMDKDIVVQQSISNRLGSTHMRIQVHTGSGRELQILTPLTACHSQVRSVDPPLYTL